MLFSIIVWKRVNIEGLTIISRKACKAYLQGQLLIGIWELGWVPPLLNEKSGSLCLNCLCKQYDLSWTPAFFLGVWNLLCARQRVFTWQAPDKNPGCWVSNELPGGQHLTCVVTAAGWQKTLESLCLATPGLQSMHLLLLPIVLYTL